jgi:ring-1,2-phenylacetyl-CoA epoxidase subunit PaaE
MDAATPRRIKRGWMNLLVNQVIQETHDTVTFRMVDQEEGGRAFDYDPGQYLTFRFDHIGPKPLVRSYTMSSSPCEGDFSAFTVKRVEGGVVSNWLCDNVKQGDVLRARGPIGKFCYDPLNDRDWLLMVAGGSGVTPFVSIMREHAPKVGQPGSPKGMILLVAYRSTADLICWPTLQEVGKYSNVRVITTLTRDPSAPPPFWHGRPDDVMLERAFEGVLSKATLMTCGPTAIMELTKQFALDRGVPAEHVKMESFES